MSDFKRWHTENAKYIEPLDVIAWCEAAYLAGQSSAEQRVKELKDDVLALRTAYKELERERDECDAQIAKDEAAIERLHEQVTKLERELDNTKQIEFPQRVEKVVEGWRKKCERLEQELEGQKKANGFLVIERDRACEQHHEVARKLFEVERERDALRERLCAHEAAVQMINAEWRDYLKEDETPIDRLKREIADNHAILGLLAEEKRKTEALKAQAGEQRYTWEQVFRAANIAKSDCKNATGMHTKIDTFVNVTQIAHDVCGTDTTPSTPAAERPDHRKVMKMALEALEYHTKQTRPIHQTLEAIVALRNALKGEA